ncbi:hypothetical protein AGABI1DRAFT_128960 [Agaricus bisporus var. burnettii JB137-S8]|uniref:G-protein coupled receptors family 1 profile domain-containing protein n=1 Tax=Agaricus bisporus var. burnettii (strain JB137-S8 / ATCC MYA-4627 / FGSC 10392) TaxID=597362 RepID=K5WTE7_AGABU|nr:uncharacterized protein AGABI1DRAFT_128960 [Agaricus bisporus var. burnettii JB137-S8]EKM78676.1 hypothetical protein AGABI1DRAFT_128960 [Agaricus bisporus var. burnettii JB137-S8]
MAFTFNREFIPIPQKFFAGAVVVNAFAILSTVALASVALRIMWLALKKLRNPNAAQSREYAFFSTQLGNYAACLLVGNMMSSAAGLIGLQWLVNRGITEGGVCQAQAFIMQVGNWASAYFTVAIAVHTFNSLVLKKKKSMCISIPTMVMGWVIAVLVAIVPLLLHKAEGSIYGPSGLSCGVRPAFPKDQFIFHLLPIFVASILSAFLYSFVFLVQRGTLRVKGGLKLLFEPGDADKDNYHRFMVKLAKSMLWYPIAYITLLVPYSVTYLLAISGFKVTWEAMVFAFVCWFLLGVVNALLLYNTFRILGPAFYGRTDPNDFRKTMASFGPSGCLEQDDKDQKFISWPPMTQNQPPAPLYGSPFRDSRRTSQHNSRLMHERDGSDSSRMSLGRSMTPVDQHAHMIAVPPPAVERRTAVAVDTSSRSLPAPRRFRTSPSSSISSIDSNSGARQPSPIVTPEGIWTVVSPPRGRQNEHWATHHVSQSWSSKRTLVQPALSAVKPTFSPPGHRPLMLSTGHSPATSPYSRNESLSSSSPTLRPLLLQRSASVNSYRPSPTTEPGFF